jgi:heme-degrading monooxygenase HmoA
MIVTVFRSRLRPGVEDEYGPLAERMAELAAAMPGYVSHKRFTADDGERLTLVEFESLETHEAWRTHPAHLQAQRKGRQSFYVEYSISVCEVLRAWNFPGGALESKTA